MNFDVDRTYFMVTFPDRTRRVPVIRSYRFLAANIFGDETEDRYYFQDAESFVLDGSALDSGKNGLRVEGYSEVQATEMLTIEGLVQVLSGLAARPSAK